MELHKKQQHIYVGMDVHKHTHTAVIISCWHDKLGMITIGNVESDFIKLLDYVSQFETDELTAIYGLEDVHSLGRSLARFLLAQGKQVKFVNSNLSYDKARKQSATHKSDEYDSLCVAKVLLDELDELPDANIKEDVYYMIKQLVTRRDVLTHDIIAIKNQLHTQLTYHYPSYNKFFYTIDCKTALSFFHAYPSPNQLIDVSEEELNDFLIEHSKNSLRGNKAFMILDLVKKDGFVAVNETRNFLIQNYVNDIWFRRAERDKIDDKLKLLIDSLDCTLMTLHGVNYTNCAKLVAEIGNIDRFPSAAKLAKYAGVSPVTYSSGLKTKHFSNRKGNRTLNSTFFRMALIQIQTGMKSKEPKNPVMYEYYQKKLKQGKTKKQALSCISRRLVNIVYRMLKDNTEYTQPT